MMPAAICIASRSANPKIAICRDVTIINEKYRHRIDVNDAATRATARGNSLVLARLLRERQVLK